MITIRPSGQRGNTRISWLDSYHTFSFNHFYDPRYMGFRDLRVINEDFVLPAKGFSQHGHDNMEILSWIVEGAMEHKDSTGATGIIRVDELQHMTAGSGIYHSEYNASLVEPLHFLQIWIKPAIPALPPAYQQQRFSREKRAGRLCLMASADGHDHSLAIHQDVNVYDSLMQAGDEIFHTIKQDRHAWVQIINGAIRLNGNLLNAGDGAAISEEEKLYLQAEQTAELLLFDLA